MPLLHFLFDGLRTLRRGSRAYWLWVGLLLVLVALGASCYTLQLQRGLVVTGMSDQVSWGFYISNFAFLVGIAAAAVLLVIPAYIFHRADVKAVVLLGEAIAVAAVFGAMTFVIVDLGRPDRVWHMLPVLGRFNFPTSMLAWDVVVLSGYLLLNIGIPSYVLFSRYRGREASSRSYFPWVLLAIAWAISIHTVTAFLFAANSARPFWNIALLAPRFIATAFVSGPALIILVLQVVRRVARYPVDQHVIGTLALIMGVSLQITLFFTGAELFTDFYNEGTHAASMRYLYFGLHGLGSLRPFIWSALVMNVIAVVILSVHSLRERTVTLNVACALAFVGIWVEKGMGLVVPGYIPTPLGEVFEYTPTAIELGIAIGVWALGILVFTLLAKAAIAIERGEVSRPA
jgi:Ni/Fe-hydrogenase subunit HybB-like protein